MLVTVWICRQSHVVSKGSGGQLRMRFCGLEVCTENKWIKARLTNIFSKLIGRQSLKWGHVKGMSDCLHISSFLFQLCTTLPDFCFTFKIFCQWKFFILKMDIWFPDQLSFSKFQGMLPLYKHKKWRGLWWYGSLIYSNNKFCGLKGNLLTTTDACKFIAVWSNFQTYHIGCLYAAVQF